MSDRHLGAEVRPFDHPHNGHDDGGDHLDAFGHTAMGADKPRAPRPKVQATSKNKAMIVAGLVLHLTGTAICLGWLGIIPNPFASRPTQEPPPPKVEKKDKDKTKVKRDTHRPGD